MTVNLLLLFNHTLTPAQEADARASLRVSALVPPPDHIRKLWANLPPESETLAPFLDPVERWIEEVAKPGDVILIQGDFGATCLMVQRSLKMGLIPVYSTTERQAVEELQPDGSVKLTHHFRHRRFRRYGG